MAQQTNYQGNRYSFVDVALEGETTQLYGSVPFTFAKGVLQSLNWDASQDAGVVQGNAIGMVGRTGGYGVGSGSMELLVSESDDWLNTLTSNGFYPIMSVYFNLRITYSVNGTDTRIDTLQGIRITKVSTSNSKGNDATTTAFDLSIAKAYKNGLLLFGDPAT